MFSDRWPDLSGTYDPTRYEDANRSFRREYHKLADELLSSVWSRHETILPAPGIGRSISWLPGAAPIMRSTPPRRPRCGALRAGTIPTGSVSSLCGCQLPGEGERPTRQAFPRFWRSCWKIELTSNRFYGLLANLAWCRAGDSRTDANVGRVLKDGYTGERPAGSSFVSIPLVIETIKTIGSIGPARLGKRCRYRGGGG